MAEQEDTIKGDWDTAIAGYTLKINKASADKKTAEVYRKRAKVRCFQSSKMHLDGDFSDVVEDASLALALSPGDESARLIRAFGYYLIGDYESVKQNYSGLLEQAKKGQPLEQTKELIPVYELLGNIYAKRSNRKDLELAFKFYNTVLGSFTTDLPSLSLIEKYREVCKKLRSAED